MGAIVYTWMVWSFPRAQVWLLMSCKIYHACIQFYEVYLRSLCPYACVTGNGLCRIMVCSAQGGCVSRGGLSALNPVGAVTLHRDFKYQCGWTEEFRSQADLDFKIEGVCLPVHSMIVSQSKVLYAAIHDTTNEDRICLESCFNNVKIPTMDSLLSQLYSSGHPYPRDLEESRSVMDAACRLGFHQVFQMGMKYLKEYAMVHTLENELAKLDPEYILWWLRAIQKTKDDTIYDLIVSFLAQDYNKILGDEAGSEWSAVKLEISKDILCDVAMIMRKQLDVRVVWHCEPCNNHKIHKLSHFCRKIRSGKYIYKCHCGYSLGLHSQW